MMWTHSVWYAEIVIKLYTNSNFLKKVLTDSDTVDGVVISDRWLK